MKNHKFHASLLLATTLLGASGLMASCNDDETSSTHKVPQAKVLRTAVASGVYTTTQGLSIDMFGKSTKLGQQENQKIEVKALTDSTISLHFPAYDVPLVGKFYSNAAQKEYQLDKVVVKFQPDGTMAFASKVKIDTQFQMTPVKTKKDDIPYHTYPDTPLSCEGTIKGKEINVKITAQPGKMPFPLTYNYVGKK